MSEEDDKIRLSRAIRPQVLIACACCLIGASYGMSAGHSAVLLPHLLSGNDTLVIDEETGSWIASAYAIVAPVGCLVSGFFMDLWGRRSLNLVGNAGMFVGWLLITFADNSTMLIAGRVVEGFSRSVMATTLTVLVDELADPRYRGFIVSSIYTCVNVGIMVISGLGALVAWRMASGMAAMLCVICIVAVIFIYESPTWFVKKQRFGEAEAALQWLWGPEKQDQAKEELEDLKGRLNSGIVGETSSRNFCRSVKAMKKLCVPRILKPFFIMHVFNVFQASCGLGIFTFYTVDIISKTRNEGYEILNDYTTAVGVSVVRVLSVLLSSFLMLSTGRRTIAMISGTFSTISALCLSIVLFAHPFSFQTEAKITFVLVLSYAGAMSFGFFVLPSLMIGETQPTYVRGFVCGYIFTVNDLLLGGVVKLYPWMSSTLHIEGIFFLFGASCLLCTVFVYLFLPETQGLTLQEIEDYFKQDNIMWITRHKYSNKISEHKDREISINTIQTSEE